MYNVKYVSSGSRLLDYNLTIVVFNFIRIDDSMNDFEVSISGKLIMDEP